MAKDPLPIALDFGTIKDPFDSFVRATGNRIERQWPASIPQHSASNATVLGLYRAAENSFGAARFLLADKPANPARKLEFSLATAPIVRSQLETLAAVVYIFADLEKRTLQFLQAGWREGVRSTDSIRAARGGDPSWKPVIDQNTENLKRLYMPLGITPKQAGDVVNEIKPWPLVGRMAAKLTGVRKDYVTYLDDWYYKALSQESHPTWSGVGQTLSLLDRRLDTGDQRHQLELYRSKQIAASLTFMLALATELDRELNFNESAGARFAWSVLVDADPDIRDFYDTLYRPALGPADMPIKT
jgi:hypothetical protein